ncbi:LytTR family DNA-binding domain-containing protein [Haliscomenobacter sp.]|uniref:LytR/AlgR family response regulator transcription factor n=1 Tax=Haliscomenobacter sp. TaxID=2717303 RepID=UPI00336524F3
MKRIAIIDDETDARQLLRSMITILCPDVEICGEADSVESAYVLIRQTQPHAILLDISLEEGNGFELLDKFPQPAFQVIFTTAHNEFALKAFRYHALDYLLKPINSVELAQTIDRIKETFGNNYPERLSNLMESARKGHLNKICLSSQEGMIFLRLDDIVRLESDGSYTTFCLLNQERHVVSRPMKEFEELLPKDTFFKLHQSHLINLSFVKKILREEGGYALMEDGCKVPIARRRKEEFLEAIK